LWQLIARTGIDDVVEPPSDQVTDRVAAQGLRRELASAIAGLPRGQRDVLLLSASGGLSTDESVGTRRRQGNRALPAESGAQEDAARAGRNRPARGSGRGRLMNELERMCAEVRPPGRQVVEEGRRRVLAAAYEPRGTVTAINR
jgi:hypothetical protein